MKRFFSFLTVATLSTAMICAGGTDLTPEQKAIALGDSAFFKAYSTILRNRKEAISASAKQELVEQAKAKIDAVKGNLGSFNIGKLGKLELSLTLSAAMWLTARAWQTYNFTPKPAKEDKKTGAALEKTWQEKATDVADWFMISSNAILAMEALYKNVSGLNKGKEAVFRAERVLSKIEKLPVAA